ncbi:hypothetical protein CH72_6270 [Burkholderia ambifaria AMMD]|nr:hypothetical protein CH72_6270 [Burkholderia ambifaria AMMD]
MHPKLIWFGGASLPSMAKSASAIVGMAVIGIDLPAGPAPLR